MNEKLLFVGGPVDGRREAIPFERKIIVVQAFAPKTLWDQPLKTVIYKKYVMRFDGGDVTFAVFEEMTPLQAFIQMCDKYPPQFGADLNGG